MEIVRYGDIRQYAEQYCALCNEPVDEDEKVPANTDLYRGSVASASGS